MTDSPMPADERATRENAWALLTALADHVGRNGWDRHRMMALIEQALKEADRLAREDAARMLADWAASMREALPHHGDTDIGARVHAVIYNLERAAAAIRASITTDEG